MALTTITTLSASSKARAQVNQGWSMKQHVLFLLFPLTCGLNVTTQVSVDSCHPDLYYSFT